MVQTNKRRDILKAGGVGIAASIAGCSIIGDGETNEWTVAVATTEGHPYTVRAEEFKSKVEDLSDNLSITVSTGGAYGGEVEMIDILQTGEIEVTSSSLGLYEAVLINQAWIINTTTFVYDEDRPLESKMDFWAEFLDVSDSPSLLEDEGYKPLIPGGDQYKDAMIKAGNRSLVTQDPVSHPDDAEGMDMRVGASPIMQGTWTEMGINAEVMPVTEVYQAAQSEVIQAIEGAPSQIYGDNLHEVMNYMTMTKHLPYGSWMVANKDAFDSLSDTDQQAVLDAVTQSKESTEPQLEEMQGEARSAMADEGMEFIEDFDIEPFRDLALQHHEGWFQENSDEVPMTLDEILSITLD